MPRVNVLSTLADIGKIMGGVVAALTLIGTVTEWWKKGPGRRRIWTKNFKQLAPGVRPAYVEALFGEPAFELTVPVLSITPGEGSRLSVTERVWPLATEGYLTTWGSERFQSGHRSGDGLVSRNARGPCAVEREVRRLNSSAQEPRWFPIVPHSTCHMLWLSG